MPPNIEIKGIHDGLLVTLDQEKWSEMRQTLLSHIQEQLDFFQGANLSLDIGEQALSAAELGRLRDQISELGLTLRAIISKSDRTNKNAETLGINTFIAKPQADKSGHAYDTSIGGDEAMLVKRTLRSGNTIEFPGHVVVIGDVNPGAEITAGGNVIVWGRLKGTVHAGASGEENAIVCALELTPTQLRISGEISITPPQKGKPHPEVARLNNGEVIAEGWEFYK